MPRNRSNQIKFYVSDEELLKLQDNIKKSKLKRSNFLRTATIKNEVIVIEGLEDLAFELKKIGVNLNQITKLLNSRIITDCGKEITMTQKELEKIWHILNLLVEKVR